MHGSRETKIINIICIVLMLAAGVIRLFRHNFPEVSSNSVIFACFVSAVIIWLINTRRRLTRPEERKYITYMAVLIIFLMAIRTVKFIFLPQDSTAARYLWYLYYVPQTFTVLFIFFAVLYIGKPLDEPVSRYRKLLYIPAVLIALGVFTNDIHQAAFIFPDGIENWNGSAGYLHGPLYFISVVWVGALLIASLAIVFTKCSVKETRKNIWIPMIPMIVGAAYTAEFLLVPNGIFGRLFMTAEVICFMMTSFAECLIMAGLFPSNDSYGALWYASDLGGGIMDTNGNVIYSSKKSIPVTEEQVVMAEKTPVRLKEGNILLKSHKVSGGYSYWTKDITEINGINTRLSELGNIIEEENSMLEGENLIKEKKVAIEEQNRLYDSIAYDTAPTISKIKKVLNSLPEDEEGFERAMKYAAVFAAYIKRRSNMLILAHQQKFISSAELNLAVAESLEYISFYGTKTHGEYGKHILLNRRSILTAYSFFESVIEKALPGAKGIIVSVDTENGLTVNMEVSSPREFVQDGFMAEEASAAGGFISTERDGNTLFVSLFLSLGGGKNDNVR